MAITIALWKSPGGCSTVEMTRWVILDAPRLRRQVHGCPLSPGCDRNSVAMEHVAQCQMQKSARQLLDHLAGAGGAGTRRRHERRTRLTTPP